MREAWKHFAVLMIATFSVGIAAQQGGGGRLVQPPAPSIHFADPLQPAGAETAVVGTVVDTLKAPIAMAHVRLRDLNSGKVVAETDTNDLGEFAFTDVEPGSYVVEMLHSKDQVIALSNAGALARYQRFTATVQLPGRWDYTSRSIVNSVNAARFFGLGSADTMTASTLSMAASSQLLSVDAGEPVSPQQ